MSCEHNNLRVNVTMHKCDDCGQYVSEPIDTGPTAQDAIDLLRTWASDGHEYLVPPDVLDELADRLESHFVAMRNKP